MREGLKELSHHGLIAGPNESYDDLMQRADGESFCLPELKKRFALERIRGAVIYQNQGLYWWEGGALFIGDKPYIQLRSSLRRNKRIWGIYSKEEILAHEGIHLVRQRFHEPRFEEMLAYQTSSVSYRRVWGALFKTPKETLFYLILLGLSSVIGWLFPFVGCGIGCAVTFYFIGRHGYDLYLFRRAFANLCQRYAPEESRLIMLHLTDEEIIHCARKGVDALTALHPYSLRIQQIHTLLDNF